MATHCNTLCNTLQPNPWLAIYASPTNKSHHMQHIQHTATRCATRCNRISDSLSMQVPLANPITCNEYSTMQHTASHCATRCNTLQHAAQHAATKSVTYNLCRSHWRIQSRATCTKTTAPSATRCSQVRILKRQLLHKFTVQNYYNADFWEM